MVLHRADLLMERLMPRRGNAPFRARQFPETVGRTLASLSQNVKNQADLAGKCSKVVSTAATFLLEYLTALREMVDGPGAQLAAVSKIFFTELQALVDMSAQIDAAVEVLREGKKVTDDLRTAADQFTLKTYTALTQETKKTLKVHDGWD